MDAGTQRTRESLAAAGTVIDPAPAAGVGLPEQRHVGAESARRSQRRGRIRAGREPGRLRRREHDRQTALARRVLEYPAHGDGIRTRRRLQDDHERNRPLARPRGKSCGRHGAFDRTGIERDLDASATGDRAEDLDVAARVGEQRRERRILVRIAAAGDADQRDTHGLLKRRSLIGGGDADLAGAHRLSGAGRGDDPRRQREQQPDSERRRRPRPEVLPGIRPRTRGPEECA